ncbi:uncharacterized protein LOC144629649 [Oculina patagonica]
MTLHSDGKTCVDVDECATSNGGCSHTCVNTDPGYTCECPSPEMTLHSDGHTCEDVDECATSNGGCSHTCVNTDPGYTCECPSPEMTLHSDGHTCEDVDECATSNGGCSHTCVNNVPGYTCECPDPELPLLPDGHTCDTDECATSNGGCSHTCVNTAPGYTCECPDPEHSLASDGHTCAECQAALGMESGVITDGQISASSQNTGSQVAAHGRLHFQKSSGAAGAWGAGTLDVHQWLQVDLNSQYTKVTRVATQGRNSGPSTNQWVTMYKLQYGDNGVHFRYYREQGQTTNKDFSGNTDRDTVVSHDLNPPIRARYIRFRPETWHTRIAMRVEVYGCLECHDALGMESGLITDGQISASSEWDSVGYAAILGRLNFNHTASKNGAWSALTNDANQWLQVDLGSYYTKVTRVATQGRNNPDAHVNQWITQYKVQYSNNGVDFKYYREQGQNADKVFTGNTDKDTIVSHDLNPPIRARYIRFQPVTWNSHISMRVELYGCPECQEALGVESGQITDGQISASSSYDSFGIAIMGRLHNEAGNGNAGAWTAATLDANQWLQIDIGSYYTKVTRVATQGRNGAHAQWVTEYKLHYSLDGVNFQYYREQGHTTDKVFAGNTDQDTVVLHDLNPPITARYIRFQPIAWVSHVSMRAELYGCQECQEALGLENGAISDGQFSASSYWGGGSDVYDARRARLYHQRTTYQTGGWSALTNNFNQWLQVDLGKQYKVTRVATQGQNADGWFQWVTSYKLKYKNEGGFFKYFIEQGQSTEKVEYI